MGSRWIARRYQPGDEVQIVDLRRLVFGDRDRRRNTERYWRWEFRDNPSGGGRIWLAVAEGTIVGQYAVIPVRMQYRGEVAVATLSLDTMTHPDHRHQGVFTTLANSLYKELETEKIPVTYGFPNENSLAGLVSKLDWLYLCSLSVFVKPLRVSRIVERLITNRALAFPIKKMSRPLARLLFRPTNAFLHKGREIKWIDRFDDRMNVFWEQVASRYRIAVVRDSAYLNWRYFDNPGREYRALIAEKGGEILGYVILRCMEQFGLRGGMIVDLGSQPDQEPVLRALLAKAERFFKKQRMDLVACVINGDEKYMAALRKRGFLVRPGILGLKEWHFGCRLNTPTLDRGFFGDSSNWFLTFGDTDII